MKTYKIFFLLVTIIIVGGCGVKMDNNYENVEQLVSEAKTGIPIITVQELKDVVGHKGDYKIIDCREKEEFLEGHIPGAINIPRGVLEFSSKISNRRETIYIYSQLNSRAALAFESLKLLKYNKVCVVDGGWEKWNISFPELIEMNDSKNEIHKAPKVEDAGGCGG